MSEVTINEEAAAAIIYKQHYYKQVKKMCPGVKIIHDLKARTITFSGLNAHAAVNRLSQLSEGMEKVRLFSPTLQGIPNYIQILYKNKALVINLFRQRQLHATFDIQMDHVDLYVEGMAVVQQVVLCIEKVVVEAYEAFQKDIAVASCLVEQNPPSAGYGGNPEPGSPLPILLSPTSPTPNFSTRSRQSSLCEVLPGDMLVDKGAFIFLQKASMLDDIASMNGNEEPRLITGTDKQSYVRLRVGPSSPLTLELLKNQLNKVCSFKEVLVPNGAACVVKFHSMKSVINQALNEEALTAAWWTDDDQHLATFAETELHARDAWNLINRVICRHSMDLTESDFARKSVRLITPRINSTKELFVDVNHGTLIGSKSSCLIADLLIRKWLDTKSTENSVWEAEVFHEEEGKSQFLRYNLQNDVNEKAKQCGVKVDWKGTLSVNGTPDDVLIFQLKLLSLVQTQDITSEFNDLVNQFFSENGKKLGDIGRKYRAVIAASNSASIQKKKNVRHEPQQSVRPKTAPVPRGMDFMIGGVTIKILKKDISSVRADCVMNSVGKSLNLDGQVSKALKDKVGMALVTALKNTLQGGSFPYGTVVTTSGFGHWKQILHCVTSLETLPRMVSDALTKAATGRHQTVAMPAFGTGNLGSNNLDAARRVCAGIKQFSETTRSHKFTSLMIVLRPDDQENLLAYQRALSEYTADGALVSGELDSLQRLKLTESPQQIVDGVDKSESNVTLKVYYQNPRVLKTVIKDLQELEKERFKTVKWSLDHADEEGSLRKLSTHDIEKLSKEAIENSIEWRPVYSRASNNLKDLVLFGDKESVTKLEGDIRVLLHVQKNSDVPSHWSAQSEDYTAVSLTESTREYKVIHQKFLKTIGQGVVITKIERIQHISLHSQFVKEENKVSERLGRSEVAARYLWHGTKADNVEKICRNGFDRSFCGDNGVVYGQGTYFHVRADYSHRYTQSDAGSTRKILVTKIVVGDSALGNSSMKTPPEKPGSKIDRYTTTVDSLNNPNIYVVYKDPGAYPEYVISYICDDFF